MPGRNRCILWLLGSCSCLVYGAVLALSARFPFGEENQERPILAVLALLGAATLAYFLALFCVFRQGTSDPKLPDEFVGDEQFIISTPDGAPHRPRGVANCAWLKMLKKSARN